MATNIVQGIELKRQNARMVKLSWPHIDGKYEIILENGDHFAYYDTLRQVKKDADVYNLHLTS